MTWYRTGTITLTSGSATITGEGTLWVTRAKPGEALYTTDGKLYEVLNVTSDTELQLTQPYTGTGGAGVPYVLVPTRSIERVLAGQVAELVNLYSTLPETATNAQAAALAAAASAVEADEWANAAGESASSADADRVAAQVAAGAADASATLADSRAAAAESSETSAADSSALAGTRAIAAGDSAAAADAARMLAQDAAASASNKEPTITPGLVSQYWSGIKTWRDIAADVRASVLTGLSVATSTAVTAADTVVSMAGKLQAQITNLGTSPGDFKFVMRAMAPIGWIAGVNSTIGNVGSGATRANADTLALFTAWWTDYTNAQLPILTSTGAASTRGASAAADWGAGKRLTVFDMSGRFVRAAGPLNGITNVNGTFQGHAIQSHNHGVSDPGHSHTYIAPNRTGAGASYATPPTAGPVDAGNLFVTASVTGITVQANGTVETRPDNIAMLGCFKL